MIALLALLQAGQNPATAPLTPENHRDLVAVVQPSEREDAWRKIGWRTSFWPAVQEARRLGQPILLWTMNGHPLGCT